MYHLTLTDPGVEKLYGEVVDNDDFEFQPYNGEETFKERYDRACRFIDSQGRKIQLISQQIDLKYEEAEHLIRHFRDIMFC